jgi:hypothetical protein
MDLLKGRYFKGFGGDGVSATGAEKRGWECRQRKTDHGTTGKKR